MVPAALGNLQGGRSRGVTDLLGKASLPAEVTRSGPGGYATGSWPGELDPRRKGRNRKDHRLEAACVTPGVLGHHDEIRATCLSLPTTLTGADSLGPSGD